MRPLPLLLATLSGAVIAADEGARGASRFGETAMPQVLEAVAGLAVVLAVIFALAWGVRRFGNLPTAGKGLIRVLGGVALGSRERAVVVAVGEDRLLLGVAPGQVRLLHVLPADQPTPGSFASDLAAAQQRSVP
jgi:flagellar protein FliO/FliZ